MLPRLWENLADWLAATPRKFRPLLLPNPGSLTRIGYTVKLAFPDRRDQKQLSELLGRAGLLGHEPPAGRVLTLVGSQRIRFRPSFLQAFDEFRRQVCRERDRCGAYGSIRPDRPRSTTASTAGCTPPQPRRFQGCPKILEALFRWGDPGFIQADREGWKADLCPIERLRWFKSAKPPGNLFLE
jgi:hypothetical protein